MPTEQEQEREEESNETQTAATAEVDQQAEDDFEASFNDDSDQIGDELPAPEPDAEGAAANENTDDATAQQAAAAEAGTQDPAQAPAQEPAPAQPSELEQMQNRLRNMEGKFGELNRNLQNLTKTDTATAQAAATESAEGQGAEAPTDQAQAEAIVSGEKMQELIREFPEWGEAMAEVVGKLNTQPAVDENKLAERISGNLSKKNNAEMQKVRQVIRVDAAHPGWENTVATKEFGGWLKSQNKAVIDKFFSKSAQDAIDVLDSYRDFGTDQASQQQYDADEQADTQANKQRRLEEGLAPAGSSGGGTPSVKTEEQDFEAAFNS